jgi:hypothetical protein
VLYFNRPREAKAQAKAYDPDARWRLKTLKPGTPLRVCLPSADSSVAHRYAGYACKANMADMPYHGGRHSHLPNCVASALLPLPDNAIRNSNGGRS